jgi:hypothetical protein
LALSALKVTIPSVVPIAIISSAPGTPGLDLSAERDREHENERGDHREAHTVAEQAAEHHRPD